MTAVTPTGGFLDRLRRGELTLMLGIRSSRSTDIVRVAHATGYHCIMIDLEHSAMSLDTAASLCATAVDLAMTPFVRVPEREYGAIGRLLDGGAHGIIAPRIETVDEARTVSRACRFPPRGQRSQLAMVPQLGMRPMPAATLNPALDEQTVVQILLETPAGIARADEIAQLDGVDMLAIGANDLTAELGVPGQYGDPRVAEAVARRDCRPADPGHARPSRRQSAHPRRNGHRSAVHRRRLTRLPVPGLASMHLDRSSFRGHT
jgi:2-keto-3-deoxy-L-rhamnonate aldolase RhmA